MRSPIIFTLLFILFTHIVHSQNNQSFPQKHIADIWEEIVDCKEPKYTLNNVDVIYADADLMRLDSIFNTNPKVECELSIGEYGSTNIKVINNLTFWGIVGLYFNARNIIFNNSVNIHLNTGFDGVSFDNCMFNQFLNIQAGENPCQIELSNCEFKHAFQIATNQSKKAGVSFYRCTNNPDTQPFSSQSAVDGNDNTNLDVFGSNFLSGNIEKTFVSFSNSFHSISIDSCNFQDDISLNQTTIINSLSISRTKFNHVSLLEFVPPPHGGFSVEWKQLANKLCEISTHLEPIAILGDTFQIETKSNIFDGKQIEDEYDLIRFEKLVASYYNLLELYKQRGNLKSADACYVEVKDLQTKMLGYEYKTNPTINNFFLWKTNQFLRYFCDYGTNPAKSIVISFYVILIFGGFYFFFYSAWDKINQAYFLNRYTSLTKYLSSQVTLGELYKLNNQREIRTYSDFKKELDLKKKEVPTYVTFMGHVLYRYSTSRLNTYSWIIGKLDLQKGLWKDLNTGKKFLIGTIVAFTIVIFVLYTILIKSMSATILSLNAFSTLGFGNIPVKGLSKYLTVIEGFIGWLLLSIFSVSLIAQMIQ